MKLTNQNAARTLLNSPDAMDALFMAINLYEADPVTEERLRAALRSVADDELVHFSDCGTHNAPAMTLSECYCIKRMKVMTYA